ncbi:phosphoethanolamine transferase [Ideonella livida]|uniref:Phosphoethanolamine--lipid A transferase n=1 Tax=Ideonella livida TaxID=2707176 RepID=A0A7C9PK12_9BURK|nr:phosphoethanolamine--lipid A transferase [Ideonella livida]NDY93848.1 phosphoethanolamine--lipid A transferase [Ideonella livida]
MIHLLRRLPRPVLAPETLVLGVIAALVTLLSGAFWQQALDGRSAADPGTWRFVAGTLVMLVAAQAAPVLLLTGRRSVRPVLALLILVAAVSAHMMGRYGVVMDPTMLRNALRTDVREASELFNPGLLGAIVGALAAGALLWRVELRPRPLGRALAWRLGSATASLGVAVLALLLVFQDFGSLMRNQKGLRYTLNPAATLYSSARVAWTDLRQATRTPEPPQPVRREVASAGSRRPALFVFVLGETARAANVSLGGYPRPTFPRLAREDGVYFHNTQACGTSTEVSVPCLFSPFGRRDYDEDRIRSAESVLQLLQRAGVRVVWLDNQSGCKGVCAGLESHDVSRDTDPALCADGHCQDGILLARLQALMAQPAPGAASRPAGAPEPDTVVVLHQLGNHGPAYYKRYPEAFRTFTPECSRNELRECSQQEIVNAYDNALRYTDHLLAETLAWLRTQRSQREVGLVYVSDHGESLGEGGLYLHGMPHAIAPDVQRQVPMYWWFGRDATAAAGTPADLGVRLDCLRQRAQGEPASHDQLFHSLLGLMKVQTPRYRAEDDLVSACR